MVLYNKGMREITDTEMLDFLEALADPKGDGDVHVNVGLYPIGQGDWCEETLREAVRNQINKGE